MNPLHAAYERNREERKKSFAETDAILKGTPAPASYPCRVCGCLDGEPGLCHAVTTNGRACYRVAPYTDWCSACGTWDRALTINFPTMPNEAKAAHYRARLCEEAAAKRGASVPGAYALRVQAVRMRRKANQICAAAGLIDPSYKNPPPERDLQIHRPMNFPPHSNGSPDSRSRHLPRMTPEERQIWANSHKLPEGMVILYADEVAALSRGAKQLGDELDRWRNVARTLIAPEDPIEFAQVMAERHASATTAIQLLNRVEKHLDAVNISGKQFNTQELLDIVTVFLGARNATASELANLRAALDRLAALSPET